MALKDFHKLGTVTIADGVAVSDAIEIPAGYCIAALDFADSWTAADCGFQISTDGGTTYVDVYSGVGTTTARARVTGVIATVSMVLVPSTVLRDLAIGCKVKLTSINAASNADLNQTGIATVRVWVAKVE